MATSSRGVPIQQLHDGGRVLTGVNDAGIAGAPPNPIGDPNATSVDQATWREVSFEMPDPKTPGDSYTMQLLEPQSWISQNAATIGGWVHLNLPELQLNGLAHIDAIAPCPPIESGPGRVILGTFQHVSNNLVDVHLQGEEQPLQVTAGHMLWSLDRGGWVAAGDLRSGERLAGKNGAVAVVSVTADANAMPVYNLDVEKDHRYLVTDFGVMAHNADLCAPVYKAVNPDIQHAASQASNRLGMDRKAALEALRALSKNITGTGRFPAGTIPDPLPGRTDSVIVPFGQGGGAVYEVKPNGTAILRTVLGPAEIAR